MEFLSQITWSSTCDELRGKQLHNDSSTCSCSRDSCVDLNSKKLQASHIWLIPKFQAFVCSFISGHWSWRYDVFHVYSTQLVQLQSKESEQCQIWQCQIWGCAKFIPTIQAIAHSNPFGGHWDMVYCIYRMYSAHVEQCRPQINSKELQASHIWLIPKIKACVHSNLFISQIYHVFYVHSTQLVQLQSQESRQCQIQRCQIWGCAKSIPTIQAIAHSNPFSGPWDIIYCIYRMYSAYVRQRFLCGPQLNSRKLQASHNWLIPKIKASMHSNLFIGHGDMMYSMYIQQASAITVERIKTVSDSAAPNLRLCQVHTYHCSFKYIQWSLRYDILHL